MRYDIQFTSRFKKDLKLAKKENKNLEKLFDVVETLAKGEVLVLLLYRLGTHSDLF